MILKRLATVIPFTLPSAALAAQLPSPPPEVTAQTVQVDRYPVHEVTFPNGVRGMAGIVYWEPTGYRPLTLDLYLPPQTLQRPAQGFPLLMYIHGKIMFRIKVPI